MTSILGFGIVDVDRFMEMRKNGILNTIQKNTNTGCKGCGKL